MNALVTKRRNSGTSVISDATPSTATKREQIVRIQPMEFISAQPDILPYKVGSVMRKHYKTRTKSGCCSKIVSNNVAIRLSTPCPAYCSSSAEVLLKSFMEIIRKESFWNEEIILNDHDVPAINDRNSDDAIKDEGDEEKEVEDTNLIKEVSEVEERRQNLRIADVDEKFRVLIQCIPLTRIAYGDHSFDHAEALVNLAQAYLDWKGYNQQAISHCASAKTILLALSENEAVKANQALVSLVQVTLCRLYLIEAKALINAKSYDQAEKLLEKCQNILDCMRKLPTISESHITWFEIRSASAFAGLYIGQNRYGQATSSIQSALDILKKRLSGIAPDYGEEIETKRKSSNPKPLAEKEALQYFCTAKSIAKLYQQLGDVEKMRGDSADMKTAIKWYKLGIETIQSTLVQEIADSVVDDNNKKQSNEAEDNTLDLQLQMSHMLARVDDIKDSLKEIGFCTFLRIAKCQLMRNDLDMAEGSIKKALEKYVETDDKRFLLPAGRRKRFLFIGKDELAKILVKSQKTDDAITLLTEGLLGKRCYFGDYSIRVIETYNLLASLHLVQGNVEKATSYLRKVLSVLTARYGPTDSKTKSAERTLNMLLAGQQNSNVKKPLTFKTQ